MPIKNIRRRRRFQREYYYRNKDKCKKYNQSYYFLKKYGITVEKKNRMIKKQNNKCIICNRLFHKRNCHLDHNHSDGVIRGILCTNCNTALGLVNDDINVLRKMIKYIDNNGGI